MIRPSALTLARHCDLAHVLAERYPEKNEATERGNAVDREATAELSGGPKATDSDARAVVEWVRATFADASVRLQQQVELFDPDTGGLITRGTADMVVDYGDRIAVVDFKKREQMLAGRLSLPDDNDQLHAYALGEALRLTAASYRTCLLMFGDGVVEPIWSRKYVPETWRPILERIRAVNVDQPDDPKGTSGPHCLQCYQRLRCPHWALPAHAGPSELEPLTREGGLTPDNVGRALMATIALEEVAEKARDQLKAWVKAHGPIVVGDRQWGPVQMPGRASVDSKALEADGLLAKYTKQGKPFEQHRWGKAR